MHVMATLVTVTQKTIPWVPEVFSHVQLFSSHLVFRQSWTKDTFTFLGHFPVHKNPTPPLTPQTTLDVLYQKLMLRVLSGVLNTKKQMKTRSHRPSAFTVLFLLKQNKKNMQWYIFLLLSSPNERTIIWNIASTCMINCVGVVGVWPWVKMERQDLGSWKQFTKNAH